MIQKPHLLPNFSRLSTQSSLWFVFKEEEVLLQKTEDTLLLPEFGSISGCLDLILEEAFYIGIHNEIPCYVTEIKQSDFMSSHLTFQPLRHSPLFKNEELWLLASRAKQILNWNKTTLFCGYCGHKTQYSHKEWAKICPQCQKTTFPRISPVVLALVFKGDKILLARSAHFPTGIYSVLAGFVEQGETLEQAAKREVYEEVGIQIKKLCYFGSQPWPFPDNLMIGFWAEYEAGEIKIDRTEIEDAQWFGLDNLPTFPNPLSLSRQMMDAFIALKKVESKETKTSY